MARCNQRFKAGPEELVRQVFLESIRQFLEGRPGEVGEAVFDKEDDLAVEFVTAASNLRAAAYGIPQQSQFNAKVGILISPTLTCLVTLPTTWHHVLPSSDSAL